MTNKKVCVVCFANFCRSPVAEHLLKNRFKNEGIIFTSAGISPLPAANMDKRSQEYLKNRGINYIHNPRQIKKSIVDESSLILALDIHILNHLNKSYPKNYSKIKLFNFKHPGLPIFDPFKLKDLQDYTNIMDRIDDVCNSFIVEDFLTLPQNSKKN